MNYKTLSVSILILFCFISINSLFSQQITDKNIDGRYIIINDIEDFFTHDENTVTCHSFILYNIKEDESSKPAHVAVNDIQNVIIFSIKSNSEKFENQRSCKLVMQKKDYHTTFRTALIGMNIKYILYQEKLITVDEFYLLKK